jgi:predicted nucleotidyltransferase
MKTIKYYRQLLSRYKPELIKKYHVRQLAIFGSFARGDETQASDLDILVDFDRPIGLDFVALADELESRLGVKVDLVSAKAVKPRMMDCIKNELIYV